MSSIFRLKLSVKFGVLVAVSIDDFLQKKLADNNKNYMSAEINKIQIKFINFIYI